MSLLDEIQKELQKKATAAGKASTEKFVPGSQKIYGTRMPDINELAAKYKSGGFDLIKELWASGAYEEKVLAAKLLNKVCKKDPALAMQMIERFSKDISDWAVCDAIGMQSLKPIAKIRQEEIFGLANKLSTSKNLWQRRLSLVLVEVFTKDKLLHPRIKQLVKKQENDQEYYVVKAVEWIERNLEKGR